MFGWFLITAFVSQVVIDIAVEPIFFPSTDRKCVECRDSFQIRFSFFLFAIVHEQ